MAPWTSGRQSDSWPRTGYPSRAAASSTARARLSVLPPHWAGPSHSRPSAAASSTRRKPGSWPSACAPRARSPAPTRACKERAGADLEAVLVEEMVSGSREFLVGMQRDAAFGPVVMFGLGGVMTEVFRDVALALSPSSERDVTELFELIRSRELLDEFRGQPAVDRHLLADIVLAVARIAEDHPHIAEIDVNPLIIAGDRPVAADALVILSEVPADPAPRARLPPGPARGLRTAVGRHRRRLRQHRQVGRLGRSATSSTAASEGPIYPVNPSGGEYFGLPVYASIEDLPEAPDLALLAVGGGLIGAVLEQCGRRGVPAAVVIAAGFSETGDDGRQAQQAIASRPPTDGVTLIGPNCMGIVSNETRLHATGFVALHPPQGQPQPRLAVRQPRRAAVKRVRAPRASAWTSSWASGNEAQVSVHRGARLSARRHAHRRRARSTWRASTTAAASSRSPARRPPRNPWSSCAAA